MYIIYINNISGNYKLKYRKKTKKLLVYISKFGVKGG